MNKMKRKKTLYMNYEMKHKMKHSECQILFALFMHTVLNGW